MHRIDRTSQSALTKTSRACFHWMLPHRFPFSLWFDSRSRAEVPMMRRNRPCLGSPAVIQRKVSASGLHTRPVGARLAPQIGVWPFLAARVVKHPGVSTEVRDVTASAQPGLRKWEWAS
jgi:hypothetical protein